jgi:hypothetical protein
MCEAFSKIWLILYDANKFAKRCSMHNDLHNNDTILISFSLSSCAASYLSKLKEMAVLSFDLRELCYIPDITHVIELRQYQSRHLYIRLLSAVSYGQLSVYPPFKCE